MPSINGCSIFPVNNIWNVDISTLPVHTNSATWITSLGGSGQSLQLDTEYPLTVIDGSQTPVTIHLGSFASESDAGPSPIPPDALVEQGNTDFHVLVLDTGNHTLYELYHAALQGDNSWNADQQSIWDLSSNALRTDNWTSADAAGLPIFPGVLRYAEVNGGLIDHALRLDVGSTNTPNLHVWPARHDDGATNANNPPYGSRVRLKASVDISGFSAPLQVILTALKKYGLMIADQGNPTNFSLTADTDAGWSGISYNTPLATLHASDFEIVDVSSLMVSANSGATPTTTTTIVSRLALDAVQKHDTATRVKMQAVSQCDILSRVKLLSASTQRDTASRLVVAAQKSTSIGSRLTLFSLTNQVSLPYVPSPYRGGSGSILPVPLAQYLYQSSTTYYAVNGMMLLTQPHIATSPGHSLATIPVGTTFTLLFSSPDEATQSALASGSTVAMRFLLANGLVVQGSVSITSSLTAGMFQVEVTTLAPISLSSGVT